MGELLQFPAGGASGDAQAEGVERRSAPSRRPRTPAPPPAALEHSLEDTGRPLGSGRSAASDDEASDAEEDGADEPRWAVPGVDDAETPEPAPTSGRAAKRAEHVAIAALTRHDASEGEIRAKLVAKGLEEQDVEAELNRLRQAGLIDDEAFAVRLIDRLRERKGLGDSAIRSALRGRLVPQAVIDTVLAEQAEDEDVAAARLQEVAEDRARRLGSLAPDVAERRLMAYLMRKGYSGSSARTAVRAALASAGIR